MYVTNLKSLPNEPSSLKTKRPDREPPPRRTAPYEDEPGFYIPGSIWLYGNTRLLAGDLACVTLCFDNPETIGPKILEDIERKTEEFVLGGKTLVCGIHNDPHRRAAVVPLRWGAPRIVVVSGGFQHHLGENLKQEPFRAARLWRYGWDALPTSSCLAAHRIDCQRLPHTIRQ